MYVVGRFSIDLILISELDSYNPGQKYMVHLENLLCSHYRPLFDDKSGSFSQTWPFPPPPLIQCCFKGDTLSALTQHCMGGGGEDGEIVKKAKCTITFDQDCRLGRWKEGGWVGIDFINAYLRQFWVVHFLRGFTQFFMNHSHHISMIEAGKFIYTAFPQICIIPWITPHPLIKCPSCTIWK